MPDHYVWLVWSSAFLPTSSPCGGAEATKLQAAENDLKQLMTDVTRAMEKAQEAVARIASTVVTTETKSTSR